MEKKINKWLNEGLIDKQTALTMLAEIKDDKAKRRKTKINVTTYTIAIILIGLGVLTFIAQNEWILKLLNSNNFLKIFLMTGATIGSFLGGYNLAYEKKNFPKLGNALILLSSLLIGATYALIGQIYHINANSSSLMFLWLISALPVAYVFKSRAVNVLSVILMILGIIFFYSELALDTALIWTIFIPVMCGALLYSIGNIPVVLNKYNDFSVFYKIAGSLPIFITLLILICSVKHSYHIISGYYLIPIAFLILLNLVDYIIQKKCNTLIKIETAALISILFMLLLLLILPSVPTGLVMFIANVLIIAMIAFGFNYGYKFENSNIIRVANQMLTIYIAVNYCRWGWSYMDKSVFFILGGSCLLALGIFLEKKRKTVTRKEA